MQCFGSIDINKPLKLYSKYSAWFKQANWDTCSNDKDFKTVKKIAGSRKLEKQKDGVFQTPKKHYTIRLVERHLLCTSLD